MPKLTTNGQPLRTAHDSPPVLKHDRHQALKAWIAAILWLIVIAIESTSYLSANNTSRFLYPLLHFLFGIDYAQFAPWHHFLRKAGHVFGYGLLSILLFRAFRESWPIPGKPKWNVRWASVAVLGAALVASLDEWHQSFLPARTGRWQDVVLDSSAAVVAQILVLLFYRSRK
jgi:VanZ family protein